MAEEKTQAARGRSRPRARTPLWALVMMMVLSGLLVPLMLLGNSEDLAFSASTPGRQLAGGEERDARSGTYNYSVCRDAPVSYEVDGRSYETATFVRGECVRRGDVEPVTVRYVPDDPETITTTPRQKAIYVFIVGAALGFVATLVALLRRLWLHLAARRGVTTG